ncbi:glycosyltransferase [Salipiger bermudensis]|uniref:glycosyltransferase n=1 Tax=Salipiger bermudensis TaxID=344736 RepID=UPI00300BF97A
MTSSPPGPSHATRPSGDESSAPPVRLLLHGAEDHARGGPTLRVPRTAQALREIGLAASATLFHRASDIAEDTVHLFNVWPPDSALQALRQLKAAGKRVVFSPIYLDFSERPVWAIPDLSPRSPGQRAAMRTHLQGRGRLHEIVPGYHAMVREMLALADHVVFLSEAERAALAAIGATVPEARASLIHNPVDAAAWQGGDPAPFRDAHAAGADYVLCVGRIEPRKNQLTLARAMRGLPLRLALAGHEGDPAYAAQIRQEGGTQLILPGRLGTASGMLHSALAGARVFALPSWSEGASLAALEAAAAGVPMVLSDRSSEREYFGDLARYCDPGDPDSLHRALRDTLDDPEAGARAQALQARVAETLDWQSHARATAAAYARARQSAPRPVARPAQPTLRPGALLLDLTALTRPALMPRQVLRHTKALARALLARPDAPRPVIWCAGRQGFLDLPDAFLEPRDAQRYAQRAEQDESLPLVAPPPGAALLLAGGLHGSDDAHLRGIEAFKARSGGAVIALIEDAGPCLRPDLFTAEQALGYTVRLHRLSELADQLVVPSAETAAALTLALETGPVPPRELGLCVIPLPALQAPPDLSPAPGPGLQDRLGDAPFALVPGPVCARGNLQLLTRIWARFAAEGRHGDLHLVVAGGIAPEAGALADSIARDPRIARRVHLVDAGDAEFEWLWRAARMVLCPSESEGWGWPVTEALARGAPCLVADIPELTGAAGVEALDPHDLPAWQARISALAATAPSRAAQAGQDGQNDGQDGWSATAEAVVSLLKAPRPVTLARALRAGESATAGVDAPALAIRFGAGWHPAETGLRRTAADRADFRLRADALRPDATGPDATDPLWLHLRLHLPPEHPRSRLQVRCGEATLFDAPVSGAALPRDLVLAIPDTAIAEDGCLPLALECPLRPAPAAPGSAEDPPPAPFGIGLVSARLLDPRRNNPLAVLQEPACWSEGRHAQEVDFALESHRAVVAPDLHVSPGWGVGSLRPRLALFVPVLPGAGAQRLGLTLRPVARPDAPSGARLYWNGRLLHAAQWQDDQPVTLDLALTEADLQSGPAVLEILPTALATPADLGLGHEQGLSGLGLFDLTLTPSE